MATVRARNEKGVLTPLEPLDLEEGKEVLVSVEYVVEPDVTGDAKAPVQSVDRTQRSGGLVDIAEMVDKMRESYPSDMWDGMPSDGAKNYKHYLYDRPKVAD